MNLPKQIEGAERIGLIAGQGELPVLHAKKVREYGLDLVAIALDSASKPRLEPYCSKVYPIGVGQAGKILKTLKQEKIRDVTFLGKVDKRLIFKRPRLDLRALQILARAKTHEDHALMSAIVRELEREGIRVLSQSLFLEDLFAPKGPITERNPTPEERADVEYGLPIARKIAELNIGQTVIVKNRVVVAVEGVEGTDETIRRARECGANGFVVIKVPKKGQDPRFDVPTVGPATVRSIGENGGSVLAVESGKTLLVDREETLVQAKKFKISILAV
jgi:DUF1009 family protein